MQVVKDHETGTSRGFAFITFSDADSGNLLGYKEFVHSIF